MRIGSSDRGHARYQWVMQATIRRTVDPIANTTSAWEFSSGTANAPWVYVKSEYAGTNGDSPLVQSPLSHLASGTSPQGALINDTSLTGVAFQQKITGGVSSQAQVYMLYSGCDGYVGSSCNHNFQQDIPGSGSDNLASWWFMFPDAGWLKLSPTRSRPTTGLRSTSAAMPAAALT